MSAALTVERVRELLAYDPSTGVFTWRHSRRGQSPAGRVAGGAWGSGGYIGICVDGNRCLAHRLAWFYVHGEWPKHQIDHINGARSDNRIANLRDVPATTNQQNRHRPQGRVPLLWVRFKPKENRWRGVFRVDGRDVYAGSHRTAEEAHAAVILKRAELGIGAPAVPKSEAAS